MAHKTCQRCGTELRPDVPGGFCPRCLVQAGIDLSTGAAPDADASPDDAADTLATSPIAPRHSPPGTCFGDYELLEEIGRGGMGVVYRARQRSLNRIVAIKMMALGPDSSPEWVKRFRAEAVSAASLHHPNIVAIHEVGIHEGRHFFVMDYVEGRSLARLAGSQPLPARRAAAYLKTIAEAVHYAHERGILHRDLKPSNVLIDEQDRPQVVDFGLARQLAGDSELTVTGQVLGSPHYLPPEQAAGQRGRVYRRTDVYALGATLYHLLTGRPPFQAESLAQTLHLVLHAEPVAPRLLNPSVPADLETVCLKCLEKEPGKRYATAQLLAEELGRYLEGKPVLARPVSRVAKVGRWCRRNPRLASAVGVALLSLLIGLAGVTWQWRQAESQRVRAEDGELLARRNAYAADMKEVQRALEDNDLGRARELLDRHRPQGKSEIRNPKSEVDLRGWEWRYFWVRCQSDEHFTLCQYTNAVSALAFSPDGKWLAVRQQYKGVTLWDTVAKRPVTELPGAGWPKALAFSPRGNLLAWGNKEASDRPVVRLRDVNTQKELPPLPHSNSVVSLAFSPDANALATLTVDGTVRIWEIESQHVVTRFLTSRVDSRPDRLSAAAKVSATSAPDGTGGPREVQSPLARIRFTSTTVFTDHYGCMLFSPDGRWLAVGEAKPQIRLLDRTTGAVRIIPAPPPADGISALAFSPDSKLLAVGCGAGDNDIHIWDLAAGTPAVRLTGHSGWIVGLAFSPDGQTLASASSDMTLRLWDVARQTERRRFKGNVDEVWAVAWTPDGQDLVTGARDGSVRYWDPAAKPGAAYAVLPESICFWGPAFLPDSKSFLTATMPPEGAILRWDTASLQEPKRLSFLGTNHTSLDLSKDGRWLVLGDAAGNVQVWDFPAGQRVTNLVFPETRIFALWFSPRGNMLAGAGWSLDGSIVGKLWALAGWREVNLPGINVKNVLDAAFSPNERTFALGYGDGTAAWWDLATGQKQAFFDCQYSSGVQLAFSPDGRWFATAGLNGLMTVWDVATRQARPIGRGYRNALHDVTFSPDSQRLVATGTSPKDLVKIWDVQTGRDVATLPGEPAWFNHIGFSPDGNTLFAASFEGTVLFWRAPSFEEIETQEQQERAR